MPKASCAKRRCSDLISIGSSISRVASTNSSCAIFNRSICLCRVGTTKSSGTTKISSACSTLCSKPSKPSSVVVEINASNCSPKSAFTISVFVPIFSTLLFEINLSGRASRSRDRSIRWRIRSAVSSACSARRMPSLSSLLSVSLIPAVSFTTTRCPAISKRTSNISRVVPLSSDTIATSLPAKAFRSEDFPAFGAPAITTEKPLRVISPARDFFRWRDISFASRPTSDQT